MMQAVMVARQWVGAMWRRRYDRSRPGGSVVAGLLLLATVAGALGPPVARAQGAWPAKPVRLIVPFAAGGTPDVVARELAVGLGPLWGQPVVIDNRVGAGGIIGADAVAKASPDGYTLLLGSDSTLVNAAFFQEKMPYDALRDFVPMGMIAAFPLIMLAHPATGFKTVAQFVAAARVAPGKFSYATVGSGSSHHLSMATLAQMAGLELIHVPYKGGAPALQDLLAGHIPVMFSGLGSSMAQVKAGRVNVLGMSGAERFSLMPDVPTVAEQGYPGFDVTNWIGILGPTGTAPAIVTRVEADLARVTALTGYRERLARDGVEAWSRSADYFARRIRSDMERNGRALRAAGVIR